jgi:polysaccharide export outer membrane protein
MRHLKFTHELLYGIVASEYLCRVLAAARFQGILMKRTIINALLLSAGLLTICDAARAQVAATTYTVKPGDILTVSVWKEPDLQGPVLVRPDGTFTIPLVGEINARDKSVADLQKIVSERLVKYIADPVVTISIQEVRGNKIYVIGQVAKPGDFVVNPQVNVMQALSMAGGATPFASLDEIRILRRTGATQQALRFDYTEVLRGRKLEQNIELQSGDVVVVP